MPICDYCGDEIEFRYINGRPTPIHVNGGWCSGYDRGSRSQPAKPFRSFQSYVNPNARCPVCGEKVYFYQSPFGGRVFFDNLRWPWPKHSCTDNPRSQTGSIASLAPTFHSTFRSAHGEPLDLYELVSLIQVEGLVRLKFSRLNERIVFNATVSASTLKNRDVTVSDLKHAPSFVVRTYESYRILEFISGRKGKIDTLDLPRMKRRS